MVERVPLWYEKEGRIDSTGIPAHGWKQEGVHSLVTGNEDLQDLNRVAANKFRAALQAEQSVPEDWKQAALKLLDGVPEQILELSKGASDDPSTTTAG